MDINATVTAVVCGGASGLGEATVRALRAAGAQVAILDRDVARGESLARDTGAFFAEVDVAREESVINAFAAARRALGQERVLVHTPAIGAMSPLAWRDTAGQIQRHSADSFNNIVRINVIGTFLCASVSAAGMMTLTSSGDERGAMVLTSSIASEDGSAGIGAYVASKAAINGVTLTWARDLGPERIRINSILPGSFATPMVANLPQSYKDHLAGAAAHPKRLGEAPEYASLALELIRNSYLNGGLFRIDGGARL